MAIIDRVDKKNGKPGQSIILTLEDSTVLRREGRLLLLYSPLWSDAPQSTLPDLAKDGVNVAAKGFMLLLFVLVLLMCPGQVYLRWNRQQKEQARRLRVEYGVKRAEWGSKEKEKESGGE